MKNSIEGGEIMVIDCWCVCLLEHVSRIGLLCMCMCVFVCVCVCGVVCVCVLVLVCLCVCFRLGVCVCLFLCRRGCVVVLSVMMSSGMEGVVGWFVVVWEDLRWFGGCEVEVQYVLHRVGG